MKTKFALCLSIIMMFMAFLPISIFAETNEPTLLAESAILIDANSKTVLYEKNGYSKQYPASITKLMTALLAMENLNPTDTLTFSKEAIFGIEPGSSHIGMDVGEEISVDSALHGLLLMSANEVANGLAEAVSGSIDGFAHLMTQRAKELGATQTNFTNPHGLHDDNHYTTAYDMALIASYLADNEYFLKIMQDNTYEIPATNLTNEVRYLSQQHKMLNIYRDSSIFREDVIGGKTGYTDMARHTLVTIAKQGETTLVAVVLKSEKNTLYSDTAALLDYGFSSYYSLELNSESDVVKTLPMYSIKSGQLYQAGNCSIATTTDFFALVQNNIKIQDITTNLTLPSYVDLSMKEGDSIGEITYLYNSKILGSIPLYIKEITYLPSPYTTVSPTPIDLTLPSFTYLYIVILVLILIIIIILIRSIRIRRKRKYRELKFNKMFK